MKECGISEKIESLGKGLDYEISEKGYNFSGGERQRIALARALIKDPDMIILDEATSNIDKKTAKEIEGMILKRFGDKIIIKISHNEETVGEGWKEIRISKKWEVKSKK